jgi:hypothetical protein
MPDTCGVGLPFEFEGVSYQFSTLRVEDYEMFHARLQADAYKAVKRNGPAFTEAEYAEQLAAVTDRIVAKKYAFGGKVYGEAAASLDGLKFFALRSLRRLHKDADEALVDRMFTSDQATEIVGVLAQVK